MQNNIPIIVTRSNKIHNIFKNKQPAPALLRTKRNPTAPKIRPIISLNEHPQHQTLDPDSKSTRTRRISSSAASKRFPKDFFKDQLCLNPIKSNRPRHKQAATPLLDTFSRKNFIAAQGEYLLSSQAYPEEDTPKFKTRKTCKQHRNIQVAQYTQACPVVVTPTSSKYNTCPQIQNKTPLAPVNQFQIYQSNQEIGPIVSFFNLTLGVKDHLDVSGHKNGKFRKKMQVEEKQNAAFSIGSERRKDVMSQHKVEGFRIRRKIIS